MPSPKWKLVVDVAEEDRDLPATDLTDIATAAVAVSETNAQGEQPTFDNRIDEIISLLGEHMPTDPNSPLASYLPWFMSLRLMLLKPSKNAEEEETIRTIFGSYSSFLGSGKPRQDIALQLSRDFMFLTQQSVAYPFLGLGQSLMSSAPAPANGTVSFFGLSSLVGSEGGASFPNSPALGAIVAPVISQSSQNSPTLTPIAPAPTGAIDSLSIVST